MRIVKGDGGRVFTIIDFEGPKNAIKFMAHPSGEDLEKLKPFLENGGIQVILDEDSPWKFEDANKAFARLETHRATGKIVVEI